MTNRLLPLAAVAAAAALALAACGGDDGDTTTVATTTPPPPPAATTTEPPPPPPPPKPEALTIVVRDGKVAGGPVRATFEKGERIVLVVRSDVPDEIHVHGYDRTADVAPGKPARIVFTASLPGRFEVELEERGLPIADLEVRP